MSLTFRAVRLLDRRWTNVGDEDTTVNFANRNAADMLNELGFGAETMWSAEPVSLDLFEQACVLAMTGFDGKLAGGLTTAEETGRLGARWIDCGRDPGYFNRRVADLLHMLRAGRVAGATHISWS